MPSYALLDKSTNLHIGTSMYAEYKERFKQVVTPLLFAKKMTFKMAAKLELCDLLTWKLFILQDNLTYWSTKSDNLDLWLIFSTGVTLIGYQRSTWSSDYIDQNVKLKGLQRRNKFRLNFDGHFECHFWWEKIGLIICFPLLLHSTYIEGPICKFFVLLSRWLLWNWD